MGRAVRVLLVSCYELGHQPLHLASPAAFLRAAGHTVRCVDVALDPLSDDDVRWAEVVAVAVPMHTAARLAMRVAQHVRAARKDSVGIVLYGLYAPLVEDAADALVDHRLGGEYEEELVRIVEGRTTARTVVLDRLRFAVPDRTGLAPLARYARLITERGSELAGYVEASRGCVHRCRHCPVPAVYDGRIRVVDPGTVVADVAQLHALGARHVTIGDPDFLNAVPHARRTLRGIHDSFPDLTVDITTKVEHIVRHAGVLTELRAMGVVFAVTAVESLSDRVLRVLDKGHTGAEAVLALRLLRDSGIEPRPSLLPFTPWSTLRDVLDLLDLVDGEQLQGSVDPVQLSIRLLVPHGSLLLRHAEMTEHLSGYDAGALTHRWRHPDPGMDRLQAELAALVEADADAGVAPASTHRSIRRIAAEAAGRGGIRWSAGAAAPPATRVGPRLSEPWFCCAEPTTGQVRSTLAVR